VFENRMLRKIFGPMRDEVAGRWRKFHNNRLHKLSSPIWDDKIKKDEMGGACKEKRDEKLKEEATWET
jgi:hypothetical protein